MIPWLNVKGTWKEPSAIWGKANGVWHDLGNVNEPYNEALALVGLDKVDSLSVLLASSEMCTALAGNAEAYGIMKENYSADMTSAIDSGFNDGLNLLNYKSRLKCYLIKAINNCSNITGGYVKFSGDTCNLSFSMQNDGLHITFSIRGTVGTVNKIEVAEFSKVVINGSGFDTTAGYLKLKSTTSYADEVDIVSAKMISSTTTHEMSVYGCEDGHVGIYDWGGSGDSNYVITEMYLLPVDDSAV